MPSECQALHCFHFQEQHCLQTEVRQNSAYFWLLPPSFGLSGQQHMASLAGPDTIFLDPIIGLPSVFTIMHLLDY